MKRLTLVFHLLLLTFINTTAQNQVTVMTYNLLNYPDLNVSRDDDFKKVIDAANPDLLVAQEMKYDWAVNTFLRNVLNDAYAAGDFIDGADTDNMLYYKKDLFTFVSNIPIHTALRDINQFTVVHKITQDTLLIYSVHLKASSGSANEQKRLAEVNQLRNVTDALPEDSRYIVAGDFNFYSYEEPAFQRLLDQSANGYTLDPINRIGVWHNNSSYADIHTQSTRTDSRPDGGSTGGLDDRFDFILISEGIKQAGGIDYVDGSYKSYGNDGNHFNKSINDGNNSAVGQEIADALHDASDHLPVIAVLDFGPAVSVSDENLIATYELKQNYPNPFGKGSGGNSITTIEYSIPNVVANKADQSTQTGEIASPRQVGARNDGGFVQLKIYDVLGREVATLENENKRSGVYQVAFDAAGLPSGIYIYTLRSGNV
ncbi:MAG: T9SS type A sorting domain-containing protein, partial [Chlorobi bacterium]|nr:T9SS type A sorting domain-containing protein [Chlorobiota bacterium]